MRERIDPLIEERAGWLFRHRAARPLRAMLERMLSYPRTLDLGRQMESFDSQTIMDRMAALIARDVEVTGMSNVPASGPALIVSNHPTGIADGIIMHWALRRRRTDAFYFANSDILRVLPQMEDIIVPVEWREEKRSLARTRQTMTATRAALEQGRIGVLFPSGRLAKRRGLKLHERPWMASAAMIARKFDVPVIPINIRARNSVLFYAFDAIHPSLRDITLFHETLNKSRQPYRLNVGKPVDPAALAPNSAEGIEQLRAATLALAGRHAPALSLIDATRRPFWVRRIASG